MTESDSDDSDYGRKSARLYFLKSLALNADFDEPTHVATLMDTSSDTKMPEKQQAAGKSKSVQAPRMR